jgi:hypothetical protein
MRILISICVGLLLFGIGGAPAAEQASSGGTRESTAGAASLRVVATSGNQVLPQVVNLPAPVHMPISWQNASNNVLGRPAPPRGLRVVSPSSSSEVSKYAGTWEREKGAAGELRAVLLNPEGTVTASYAAEPPHSEQTIKGRWRLLEQGIHLDFTSQTEKTNIPALRETMLSVKHEGAGIILVGEKGARFVRTEPGASSR